MKVLHEQYKIMSQFQNNVEVDLAMPSDMAEVLFSGPMTKIFNSLSKVLKDNKVANEESVNEEKRIMKLMDSVIKVQKLLVNNAAVNNG